MALKNIRIGSAEDIFQYDDGSYDSAIEVDAPIKAASPIDPNDVLRLGDVFPDLVDIITTQAYFLSRIY